MRVLIIKLSSMGDLMHAFPALTDAAKHYPDITFDWVVDESFSEVPLWHPNVEKIITTAHRRWRKNIFKSWQNGEFSAFYKALNLGDYDVVIDLQSNLKSAVVSWLRRGSLHGYDAKTCRESLAHLAYENKYFVALESHAIERQRELLSKVFSYEKPHNKSNYGVDLSTLAMPPLDLPKKYIVFVHNASWETKLWPIENWQQLASKTYEAGYSILLPCGNEQEFARAKSIASQSPSTIALPKMNLNDMAAIISNAKAAVCSDTGLAHMCAVASTPAITLYAVTDTALIGTVGKNQYHLVVGNNKQADMKTISVEMVWEKLHTLLR